MSKKLSFLMALILVSGIISSSEGTTPQISSVSGTVAQGNTITISGSYMMDEDKTDWDVFFSNNPNASSFEGTSPSADGYSAIGPSGGTYVTDVKVLGSKSIRFHVQALPVIVL